MMVKIEIWKNKFDEEWNCNITTEELQSSTEYWALDNFYVLLKIISERIPNAKLTK